MTTPEHFDRVRALFVGAHERSALSRRPWLEEQCAGDVALLREVEDLLDRADAAERPGDADRAPAAKQRGAKRAFSDLARDADSSGRPQRIGEYEILHVIGRGGMGTVYAAEQKHPRRRVALKVLHGGVLSERTRRRFEYEGELLGRLRHRGIAHIYEAGVADSGLGPQPFLAMELVDGDPLARWIDQSRPTMKRKLELLVELCLAVQHAHERGVIHRDLKPDNILVERDGRPKVLDFGIARAIEADVAVATRLTEAGAIIGTLSYMSPEQLAEDPDAIDTRSDVYSLGVILYEFVAGRRPHDIDGLAIGKAIETIRFDEPAPISAVASVNRDLEIIVAKAIERDPARRYPSAAALADDVRRFLADEPITARPASTLYQVRKLVRRHRAFAIGSAAVLVMLVLGLAGTLWQAQNADARRVEAEREKSIAQTERNKAVENAAETELVADFQSHILSDLSVDEFGHSLVVELRKDLQDSLGRTARSAEEIESTLASFDDAVKLANSTDVAQRVLEARVFGPAVEKLENEYAGKRLLAAMIETPLASTLQNLGLLELGARAALSAVESRRTALGDGHEETLVSIHALARIRRAQGRLSEAEALDRDTLARRRAMLGDLHPDTLTSIGLLAQVLSDQGKLAESEPLFREAITGQRAVLGSIHRETLTSIDNLGQLLQRAGKLVEAESLLREALAGFRATSGDGDTDTLRAMANLAVLLRDEGKHAEAGALLHEALAGIRVQLGDTHPYTLTIIGNLATLLRDEGRLADAQPLARECLAGFRAKLGDDHPYTLVAINDLASLLQDDRRYDEAEPLFREALAGFRIKLGNEHLDTLSLLNNLAVLLHDEGRYDEAEPLLREGAARCRARFGNSHPKTLKSINSLARVLRLQGRLSAAEPLYREALSSRRETLGDGHLDTLRSQAGLAFLLQSRGEFLEASTLFAQAIELGRRLPPNEAGSFVREMQQQLRDVYREWHAIEPAAGHDCQADEIENSLGVAVR